MISEHLGWLAKVSAFLSGRGRLGGATRAAARPEAWYCVYCGARGDSPAPDASCRRCEGPVDVTFTAPCPSGTGSDEQRVAAHP